jgi:hypothetical protein
MIIRVDQFAAFSRALRENFLRAMTGHLRTDFAADLTARGIADEQLEALVRRSADQAGEYGFTSEQHLRLYLECIAILGPDFDTKNSAIREILTREDASADEKISEINEFLIFGLQEPR